MIIKKDNPKGIDFMIDRIQTKLGSMLSWNDPYIYGRVYLNSKPDGNVVAEAYIGNDRYKDIFVDKSRSAVIGFVENGDVSFDETGKVQTMTVDIVCSVMLNRIYDTVLRNDEEALQEVLKVVQKTAGWKISKIRKGNVKNVFSFMDTKSITFRDMQPYANFAISCDVNYLNNIC